MTEPARYSVRHQTRYIYADQVSISYNRVHSQPRPSLWQSFAQAALVIDPLPAFLARQTDFFGNPVTFFTVQEPHQELQVTVGFEATVTARTYDEPVQCWDELAEQLRLPPDLACLEASQFRFPSTWVEVSEPLRRFAAPSFKARRSVLEGALDLCRRIHAEFTFDSEATTIATPVQEVLDTRRGVCQDFAHLFIGSLRSLGLAARYVSGYILTTPPPGQERLQGADASHAWVSVWAPPLGWVDLDPTNNLAISDQHVTLAWGRDFHDVSPMRGVVLGGGAQVVKVGVDVVPLALS
jgi:transglutaminase-like putative cysteine protease